MRRLLLLSLAVLLPLKAARALPGCTVTLASINFGNYDVFSSAGLAWSGTLSWTCTGGANGPIYIDVSSGASGTPAQRKLAAGANQLNYNIFTDSTRQSIWFDGNSGTGEFSSISNPQNGAVNLTPIYGFIPGSQNVSVGTYQDTLTLTIYWTKKQVDHSATSTSVAAVTVISKCSITTTPVQFGAYDPVIANKTAPLLAQGAVTTICTKGAATTIGLDTGLNPNGAQRRLKSGSDFLGYELYKDAPRTVVWGNSGAALFTPPNAPDTTQQSFTVYGRIPAGQDVSAGSYADTVTATITY